MISVLPVGKPIYFQFFDFRIDCYFLDALFKACCQLFLFEEVTLRRIKMGLELR